jgi:hypothetical protein
MKNEAIGFSLKSGEWSPLQQHPNIHTHTYKVKKEPLIIVGFHSNQNFRHILRIKHQRIL